MAETAKDKDAQASSETHADEQRATNPTTGERAMSEHDSKAKYQKCPMCDERAEVYEGDNPHKQGTMFCPTHGRVKKD